MKTLYKLVDGKIEAIEFAAGRDIKFLNKSISTLKIKKDILIAAIQRKNKTIFPTGSDVIKENDRVIIVSKDTITKLGIEPLIINRSEPNSDTSIQPKPHITKPSRA